MDDWALMARVKKDPDAMTTLFYRHKDYVYRLAGGFVCNPSLADDITQDVFLRLHRMRRRFAAKAAFRTWLYRVTLNTSREFVRKQRRRADLLCDYREMAESANEATIDYSAELQTAMANLPQRQREALVLRYFERLSIRETAQVMNCREGTVKATVHAGLGNLRRAIPRLAAGDLS